VEGAGAEGAVDGAGEGEVEEGGEVGVEGARGRAAAEGGRGEIEGLPSATTPGGSARVHALATSAAQIHGIRHNRIEGGSTTRVGGGSVRTGRLLRPTSSKPATLTMPDAQDTA
jgi:hypothetical protein